MEGNKVVGTIPFSQNSELRLSLTEYNGRTTLHLRVWSHNKEGQAFPTDYGVPMRPEWSGQLADLFAQAAAMQVAA